MSRQLQIGERIGDYEIVGFLGAGGMGQVFHGVHTKIGRAAAIKVLSTTADNSTFAERFFNEARLQSSLHHPNIATLYDFKEIDGRLIIFMEYADGECFEDVINRRGFTVEEAVRAFEAVCDAVAFIHSHGIVHRDIKAQNIKLTTGNKVKLLDFGIAKDEASLRLTRADGVIGTPTYLSPEQLSGKGAGPLSDIWSLGVLFYEMLTGTAPFRGDHLGDLLSAINAGNFVAPQDLNPAIQSSIVQIVTKCLRREPENRYQSVSDILADLRAHEHGPVRQSFLGFQRVPNAEIVEFADPQAPGNRDTSGMFSSRWVPLIGVGSLTAVLFVAIAAIAFWPSAGTASNAQNTNTNSKNLVQQPELASGKTNKSTNAAGVSADSGTTPRIGSQPSSASHMITVTVETAEGKAKVYRGESLIGETPLQLDGVEGETVNLVLRRDGYEDEAVRFDIMERKRVYTYSMKRKR